ncbi:TPA: hypothetical protein R4229_004196 [Morganella morganii]|nr:hypothetical protein [Morganella morganii]
MSESIVVRHLSDLSTCHDLADAYWKYKNRIDDDENTRFLNFVGMFSSTVSGGISLYKGIKSFKVKESEFDDSKYQSTDKYINIKINNLTPYSLSCNETSAIFNSTFHDCVVAPDSSTTISGYGIPTAPIGFRFCIDDGKHNQIILTEWKAGLTEQQFLSNVSFDSHSNRAVDDSNKVKGYLFQNVFDISLPGFEDDIILMANPLSDSLGVHEYTFISK